MSNRCDFWPQVSRTLQRIARADHETNLSFPDQWQLSEGQRASLTAIAERLPSNGVVIADEVGMGKTRLAAAVIRAVVENGGRVAVVIPPGLGFQWADEVRDAGVECSALLRSLGQYFSARNASNRNSGMAWADGKVTLISHAFANWRLGESSQAWRWSVFSHVYAQWRRRGSRQLPHGFHKDARLDNDMIAAAADAMISEAIRIGRSAEVFLDGLLHGVTWPETRIPANYGKGEKLRQPFERLIGLGLGEFDLIVIDEAHKSRHFDSGLAKLIEGAMWTTPHHRRLALTATPVELHPAQWKDILDRIQAPTDGIDAVIETYATAVRTVRRVPSNEQASEIYAGAARRFEKTLTPYLLRRDKREDEAVRRFVQGSGLGHDAYRRESEILVDPCEEEMPIPWRRAVCAAEALSHIAGDVSDGCSKRARLTMGSGHGIATLLDEPLRDATEDQESSKDAEESGERVRVAQATEPAVVRQKREERHRWWGGVIRGVANSSDQALYGHPAILAAVHSIESSTANGEKVLVFGRFTRPLRALVQLLNAREMWRALGRGEHWPQSTLNNADWLVAEVAQRQLRLQQPMSQHQLFDRLLDGYRRLESARERFRRHLIEGLEEGLESQSQLADGTVVRALFDAFKTSSNHVRSSDIANVTRALHALGVESLDTDEDRQRAASAFVELIGALRARNEEDEDGDSQLDADEAAGLWGQLSERLRSEYARSDGDHARLLYGRTEPTTRRLLQLAFNREHANPRVLVAQSMVGREGLNLHLACRTVVLLHPEWNPGVVEQQIGRVDRIGSRWQQLCERHAEGDSRSPDWPRIEVRPVIFRGTYDEQNWAVLRDRWRDLRAQLHGIVLAEWEVAPELREIVRRINSAAPHFSPSRVESLDGAGDLT
ncbi:helicase-related protein [uncultured Aquimonas sp.]|uniref:helicase-related protein n=1 Tax=uncultured Aquimonas sp. TaxID=385483 RepID=UPI000B0250F8|nr:helicase-related protein [uncultured Aquimonas sp.]